MPWIRNCAIDTYLKRPNCEVTEAVKYALQIVQIYFDRQFLNKRHNLSLKLIGDRCWPCLTFPQYRLRSRLPGGNREVSSSPGKKGKQHVSLITKIDEHNRRDCWAASAFRNGVQSWEYQQVGQYWLINATDCPCYKGCASTLHQS